MKRITMVSLAFAAVCFFLVSGIAYGAETPKYGGTLRVALDTPIETLSAATTRMASVIAAGPIYDSLLTYDLNFQPHPGLAKSWSVSSDGLTYTFNLVDNARWHDGKPFTSADVKFTIEEILRKYHPAGAMTWGVVERIDTPDNYTVVFKLKNPTALFLKSLGPYHAKMMPKHIYEGTDIMKNPANMKPIGTGPFKFVEEKQGSHLIVERNGNYWKPGLPYLDKIIFRIMTDSTARVAALENGDIDLLPIYTPLQDVERLRKNPQFVVTDQGYEGGKCIWMIKFNLRNKPLSDLRVRQAISHALDKEKIHKLAGYGFGKRADGPFPRGLADWYNENQTTYPHDLKKANRLLDEAGYPRDSKGIRFKLGMELITGMPVIINICEVAREMLKEVGIDFALNIRDMNSHVDLVYKNWNFDCTNAAHGLQFDPCIGYARYLVTKQIGQTPWTNCGAYSNPKVDELFEKASVENDPGKRKKMFFEIQEIVAKDIPMIYFFDYQTPSTYHKYFSGLPMGPSYWGENYGSVWWKGGSVK